jgi:hypothetical protein
MLLMVTLGAIAVDLGQLHGARAELQGRADAAANDAVTAGLDQAALRAGHGYRLDPRLARAAAVRAATIEPSGGLSDLTVDVVAVDARTVTVVVEATVEFVFAPALPGGPHELRLRARARARAEIR